MNHFSDIKCFYFHFVFFYCLLKLNKTQIQHINLVCCYKIEKFSSNSRVNLSQVVCGWANLFFNVMSQFIAKLKKKTCGSRISGISNITNRNQP